jgi:protein-S-isoprenylcysteine O-methyltransferase Ste14
MRRAGTPIVEEPLVPGRPTSTLITDGPFGHTRNPGYLAGAMVYAGIASLANALWAFLFLPVTLLGMQRTAIKGEERYLEREFGEEYLQYKARVRRWI